MSEDLEASTQIGQVLAGKYRVDRVLGVGGMGIVVAAMHLQLDQRVALKFIRREALVNHEVVSRFEREARAAVRLKSEHVARIIDVGNLESGSPYIVMEYLEGQDLAGLIHQVRSLEVALACDYLIQACDAIAEAHSLGIIHRDLKPGNLFLATTSHGRQAIKVLDFGISKSQAGGDYSMTRTQAVMGSPGYMSPEQMRSTKNVDGRSDVWSLGVILYELVSGRPPFDAETFTALCVKISMDPHPPLPALPMVLPAGFESVVNRALEKNPAVRFQSAIELAQALAPYASAAGRDQALRLGASTGWAHGPGARVGAPPSAPTTLSAAAGQTQGVRGGGRSRLGLFLGLGIGAAAMIGVTVAVSRPGGEASSSSEDRTVQPANAPAEQSPEAPPAPLRPIEASPTIAPRDAGPASVVDATPPAEAARRPDAAPALERRERKPTKRFDPYESAD